MTETNINNILNLKQKGDVKFENGQISFHRKQLAHTNIYKPLDKFKYENALSYSEKNKEPLKNMKENKQSMDYKDRQQINQVKNPIRLQSQDLTINNKNQGQQNKILKPNYPSFENQNTLDKIGWGLNKATVQQKYVWISDQVDRINVKLWDQQPKKRFLDLTGNYVKSFDKFFEAKPESHSQLNQSHYLSNKSFDQKFQSLQKTNR